MKAQVLSVDDDPSVGSMLKRALAPFDLDVSCVTDPIAALDVLATKHIDVVLTDLRMARLDGVDLCERIRAAFPDVPVIVVTAFGSMESAVRALRAGAYDFVTKPVDIEIIARALRRAVEHRFLKGELLRLQREAASSGSHGIIGESEGVQTVLALIDRVADTDVTVLLTGESGTGKELVARAIHLKSKRAERPLVAVNCAAIPEALVESELFGHARGAFTDAQRPRAGLMARARGGTLFLDEIADIPLAVQPKLLRALQERTIRPVGADDEEPIDVRIIAATHVDLEEAVRSGRFREDLFYRLDVVRMELPPLRERGGDVLLIAHHFLERFSSSMGRGVRRFSEAAAARLRSYAWPGNIRELANCVERAVTLARLEEITVDDLPPRIRQASVESTFSLPRQPEDVLPLEEIQRRYVLAAVEAAGGSKAEAARLLNVDRATLYRWLARYQQSG
ncbi:MAG: sigma-54-dependent Fis family transcriptional regulator [Myxococcales bacterium]|nr:sigma-54-dependent Fis family transcriptional regulator [Myxococcales bacterium]